MLRILAIVTILMTLSACGRSRGTTASGAAECGARCDGAQADRCHPAGEESLKRFLYTATTDPTGAAVEELEALACFEKGCSFGHQQACESARDMLDGIHLRQAFPGAARVPNFSDAENRYAKVLEKLCALEPPAWCKKAAAALRDADGPRAELAAVAACNASRHRPQKSCANAAKDERASYEAAGRDCRKKQPSACRLRGETLYFDAHELQMPRFHARWRLDRAMGAFENECRLRGLTSALLGPGLSPAPTRVIEPIRPGDDPRLARDRARRRALEMAQAGAPAEETLDPEIAALAVARPEFSACLLTYLRGADARRLRGTENSGEASSTNIDAGAAAVDRAGRIRFGLITTTSGIDPEKVRAAAAKLEPDLRRCYAVGLRKNQRLEGRISTSLVVDALGDPFSTRNAGSDLPDSSVLTCVIALHHEVKLGNGPAGRVTIPLMLTPH
jgi:hypothetical protein